MCQRKTSQDYVPFKMEDRNSQKIFEAITIPDIHNHEEYNRWYLSDGGQLTPKHRHTRKRKEGHIARPPNAFLIFRAQCSRRFKGNHQQELSSEIGRAWNEWLSEEEKARYYRIAEILRDEHRLMHPDYKFEPERGRTVASRVAKTVVKARSVRKARVTKKTKAAPFKATRSGPSPSSSTTSTFSSSPCPSMTRSQSEDSIIQDILDSIESPPLTPRSASPTVKSEDEELVDFSCVTEHMTEDVKPKLEPSFCESYSSLSSDDAFARSWIGMKSFEDAYTSPPLFVLSTGDYHSSLLDPTLSSSSILENFGWPMPLAGQTEFEYPLLQFGPEDDQAMYANSLRFLSAVDDISPKLEELDMSQLVRDGDFRI